MVARDILLPVDPDDASAALTDSPERLVVWSAPDAGDGTSGSRVELVLVPVPGGTRVTVTEAPVGPLALATA